MRSRSAIGVALIATAALLGCSSGGEPTASADEAATPVEETTTSVAPRPVEAPGTYGSDVVREIAFGYEDRYPVSPPRPEFLDIGAGSIWVGHHRSHAVTRIDPDSGEIEATVAIDPSPGSTAGTELVPSGPATGTGSILATDDAVWALDVAGFAWAIDPATNEIISRVEVPDLASESGIAMVGDDLWVLTSDAVARLEPSTGTVTRYPLGHPRGGNGPQIVADGGSLWVASADGVVRVSADTGEIVAVVDLEPVGLGAIPLGIVDGLVWGVKGDNVFAIDPTTNQVVDTIAKPAQLGLMLPDSATVADGALWVLAWPTPAPPTPATYYQAVRFDLATHEVEHVDLMNGEFDFISGVAASGDDLWVTDFARGNLLQVAVARP